MSMVHSPLGMMGEGSHIPQQNSPYPTTPRSSLRDRGDPRASFSGSPKGPPGGYQPRTLYSPQNVQNVQQSHGGQTPSPGGQGMSPPSHSTAMPTGPMRPDSTFVSRPPQSTTPSPHGQQQPQQQQQQQSSVGQAEQELIEQASKTMDQLMCRDLQIPTLFKSLVNVSDPNSGVSGSRPVSGFLDYDYPPLIPRRAMTDNQFEMVHNTPIPAELNEMLGQSDVQFCHMGLFPGIYRAWMTIDSDLYLWDLRDGSDLAFYDGLKEPIITMALVPVKSDVFQSSIQNLLCIATASEVVILGFVLTDPSVPMSSNKPVMELVSQPIFVISTEGTAFCVIQGTSNGRILLGAKDGSIHEINYQARKGWLTDRCSMKNLTNSYLSSLFKFIIPTMANLQDAIVQVETDSVRNLLFTRSESGLLQAYDLGVDGNGFSRIGYMTFEGIVNEVVSISKKTLESNIIKKMLTISAVTSGEISLVATLDNGTRLFFSCYNPPSAGLQGEPLRSATQFQLVHVRLPPGFCTATSMQRPSTAHTAFYSRGVFALSAQTSQDVDSFWLISPFMYPSNCYSEVFTIQKLPGRTLDIRVLPGSPDQTDSGLEDLPDIIIQHMKWQREIVVLTSNGTSVFRAHKPYELLKCLLAERGGAENVRGHFELGIPREQPLANSVILAVHPSTRSEPSVHDMAVKAFFMYGNVDSTSSFYDPIRIINPHDTMMDFNPNVVSTPRQDGMGVPQYGSPLSAGTSGYVSPQLAGANAYGSPQGPSSQQLQQQQQYYSPQTAHQQSFGQYQNEQYTLSASAQHDALYLVVGRILFHFWNRPLVQTGFISGPGSAKIIIPNIQGDEVTQAILFLQNTIAFMNGNPSLFMSRTNLNPSMMNFNTPEGRRVYNQELEKNSILALKTFLNLTLEVLSMWKILCDHQFHIVLHGVDSQLQTSTMRDLVVSGQATVSVIINALISKYLGDNAAVDAISLRLREVCPTLFKSEDAIGSKVAEILSKVKNSTESHEREALLKESLMLSEKICGHGRVNVRTLCKQYSELGFPLGAVRLCVSAAKAADPDQLALTTVKTTSTSSDPVGMQAFHSRTEIYRIAFDILDNYVHLAATSQSPVLRGVEERVNPKTAQRFAEETIHAILNSEDEMFHISLYNWLLEKKQFDRLLEIKHPFLDSFLQRAADAVVSGKWPSTGASTNDTRVLDLLWRHHEMNQNHIAAAQILSKLAESTTTGLNLQQRLEYMSRAIICSKSAARRGDLLETLEDKVEVAQIQKNILECVNAKIANLSLMATSEDDTSGELKALQDIVPKLNSQLMTITQLYTEVAHPFKLHDAKLEIFFAAGHGEKGIIEAVWSDIIEEELTNSGRRTMESQMEVIRRKLVTLGRKYINSPTFFPVGFLIEHLESMKPEDTENVSWVFRTMLEVGVGFPDVLFIYDRLWRQLLNRQGTTGADLQIAKVIMYMIDSFAKQELDVRTSFVHRPELLEKCKDLIATMIVEFSSRFDPPSTQMTQMLNHVKDRLDRIHS